TRCGCGKTPNSSRRTSTHAPSARPAMRKTTPVLMKRRTSVYTARVSRLYACERSSAALVGLAANRHGDGQQEGGAVIGFDGVTHTATGGQQVAGTEVVIRARDVEAHAAIDGLDRDRPFRVMLRDRRTGREHHQRHAQWPILDECARRGPLPARGGRIGGACDLAGEVEDEDVAGERPLDRRHHSRSGASVFLPTSTRHVSGPFSRYAKENASSPRVARSV